MSNKQKVGLAAGISLTLLCISFCVANFVVGLLRDRDLSFNNLGEQLANLPDLKTKLVKEYPGGTIELKIGNGHVLDVKMFNYGYLNLSELQRQEKAKEIGSFITQNYNSVDTIDTIVITFVERISIGVNVDKSLTYIYHIDDFIEQ
jgi:hypothetical protein